MGLPRALIIEDDPTHALIAETLLREVGFAIQVRDSLPAGKQLAWHWLDPQRPLLPTVILLDLKLPHRRCTDLEGTLLIAALIAAMEAGHLHPAHVVAITSEPTELRLHETALAGCSHILEKPLCVAHAQSLRALVEQPPTLPGASLEDSFQRHVLRRNAAQVLGLLEHEAMPTHIAEGMSVAIWGAEQVKVLLTKPAMLAWQEPWGSWLRRYGGLDAVRQRLRMTPLPERLLTLRDALVSERSSWASAISRLHCSRATYYRQLDALALELAMVLNSWDGASR